MTGTQPLFPEPLEPNPVWLSWAEPHVHWYTTSTREEAVVGRRALNDWYSRFVGASDAFAAKVRSEDDQVHFQAVDELFVHQLLVDAGWTDIRYEEGGAGPDFRLYTDGDYIGAIEVASLFATEDETAEQKKFGKLADEINDRVLPTAGYFVGLDPEVLERTPSVNKLSDYVRSKAESLPDPDEADLNALGMVEDRYEEDGVAIMVRFIPMRPGAGARHEADTQIVGMGPMRGGFVSAYLRLRDRLGGKAGRKYDLREAPYLIAVGIHEALCTEDQVMAALYGNEAVIFDSEHPDRSELTRQRDGFFGNTRERPTGRNRRVSAVCTFSVNPSVEVPPDVRIYDNPFPAHPWPSDVFLARRLAAARTDVGVTLDWEG